MKNSTASLITLRLTLILFGLALPALVCFTHSYLVNYQVNNGWGVSFVPFFALVIYDPLIVLANIGGFVLVLQQKSPSGRLKVLAWHILGNFALIMIAIVLVILLPPVVMDPGAAPQTQTSAADGTATFTDPQAAVNVHVFSDAHDYVSIFSTSSVDVLVPVSPRSDPSRAGGYTGQMTFPGTGAVELGLAGTSFGGSLVDLNFGTLLGDMFTVTVSTPMGRSTSRCRRPWCWARTSRAWPNCRKARINTDVSR